MTTAGIITMVLSIGAVWALLVSCCVRLLRKCSPSSSSEPHK